MPRRRPSRPSRVTPARSTALAVLTQVRERDAFVRDLLDRALSDARLPAEERGFASVLAYGVVSTYGTLDEELDRFLDRPGQVAPAARDALRISAYELLFLRKPAHSAVDQGVELVRSVAPRAAGMANAVLRKVAHAAADFPYGDPERDLAALARSQGFPRWMAGRLSEDLGYDGAACLMRTANGQAPVYLAHNPFAGPLPALLEQLDSQGVETAPVEVEGCLLAQDAAAAVSSSALAEGRAVVADAASQLVASLAAPRDRGAFLEVGAGRGTKTLLLQAQAQRRLGGPARLFSVDNHAFKIEVLTRRMKVLGVPAVTALVGDARRLADVDGLPASFAGAFIDAPCSGLGTLRRHPEERWRCTPADIDRLARLQLSILESAAPLVESGALLTYATCTVTRAENEQVVEAFLNTSEGRRFAPVDLRDTVPDGFGDAVTDEGFVRTRTFPGGPDAHFCAQLRAR